MMTLLAYLGTGKLPLHLAVIFVAKLLLSAVAVLLTEYCKPQGSCRSLECDMNNSGNL
jgi:hypothetical protein